MQYTELKLWLIRCCVLDSHLPSSSNPSLSCTPPETPKQPHGAPEGSVGPGTQESPGGPRGPRVFEFVSPPPLSLRSADWSLAKLSSTALRFSVAAHVVAPWSQDPKGIPRGGDVSARRPAGSLARRPCWYKSTCVRMRQNQKTLRFPT